MQSDGLWTITFKPMAGIHLPDIGRLGIRIATGMRDKKRVGPTNLAEHARLKLLSQRIDSEKKERLRVLVKEERHICCKKKKIDYRRLQIHKTRQELNGNILLSDGSDKRTFRSDRKSDRRDRRVRFPALSLECKARTRRTINAENFHRSGVLRSQMVLRDMSLKHSTHPLMRISSRNQKSSAKLFIRLPSLNERDILNRLQKE